MSRQLAQAGLAGVGAGVLLTVLAVWLTASGWVPRLVPPGPATWALLGFVLLFSLAELPLMVFALRRMAGSAPARATNTVMMLTAAGFVFFAAFYAAPFTVLTGQVALGVALAGLCLLRLACVLRFVGK